MHESHNVETHRTYMYSPKVIKTKKLTVSGSFPYYKIDFSKILKTHYKNNSQSSFFKLIDPRSHLAWEIKNILRILSYRQGMGCSQERANKQQETLKSSEVLGRRCASPTSKEQNPAHSIWGEERIRPPGVFFSTKNSSLHKSSADWKKDLHVQQGSNHFQRIFKW